MTDVLDDLETIEQRHQFLQLVAEGTPTTLAGHEVKWSPRRTRVELADPEFAELVEHAAILRDDSVERKLYDMANKGNMIAIQLVLLNRRNSGSGGFRDVKRIEVHTTSEVKGEIVHSVRQGLAEALQAGGDIAALQAGGILDVDSEEVVPHGSSES